MTNILQRSKPDVALKEASWGAPVTGLSWRGEAALFTLGDGTVRFWLPNAEREFVVQAHAGAILASAIAEDGASLITGGDDGRVVHTRADGSSDTVATSGKHWIDHVALAPWGSLAWTCGKTVEVANARLKSSRSLDLPSSCGGLAFAPKGERLACAHYGGATVLALAHPKSQPDAFAWRGSHIAITWSPDARFLVTSMQESAVHIWRVSDKRDLHMHGYPAKPKCFSWSNDGEWLATSGGPAALLWPFKGKNGPAGQNADEMGRREALVSSVAWHPNSDVLAIGYRDGVVALADRHVERLLYLRRDDGEDVACLAWSADGAALAFGTDRGSAGLIDCSKLRKP